MPAGLAIGTAAAGLFAATGSIYSANKQADTAQQAGVLQSKAASDTLAFQKTQAAQDQANWEAAQKFNIDQYNQKEARLQPYIGAGAWANTTLSNLIGGAPAVSATKTPPPVATLPSMQGPLSSGSSSGGVAPSPRATPTSASSAGGDPITQALLDNYQSLGVQPTGPGSGPTDIAYYAQQINNTGGLTPDNMGYWLGPHGRIASDLARTNGGSRGGAASSGAASGQTGGVQTPSLPMNFAASASGSPVTLGSLVRTPALAPAAPVTLNSVWQPPPVPQYG